MSSAFIYNLGNHLSVDPYSGQCKQSLSKEPFSSIKIDMLVITKTWSTNGFKMPLGHALARVKQISSMCISLVFLLQERCRFSIKQIRKVICCRPCFLGIVIQSVRAPPYQRESCGFESHQSQPRIHQLISLFSLPPSLPPPIS